VQEPRSENADSTGLRETSVQLETIISSFNALIQTGIADPCNSSPKYPDVEIANHVRAALDANAEVMKAAITVSVSDGVVTLPMKEHAEGVAHNCSALNVRNDSEVTLIDQR
jgi:hypothetical protein